MKETHITGFLNGKFLLGAEEKLNIFHGNCKVSNGRIIGFTQKKEKYDETIDLKGSLVTPSTINAHIHLGESLFQGLVGRWNLEQYLMLAESWNNYLGNKRNQAWLHSAYFTANEMIKSGTSIFCAARSNDIAKLFGLKTFSGYPLMESEKLNSFLKNGFRKYVEFSKDTLTSRNYPGVFFHSLYSNGSSTLELARKCLSYNTGFLTVHVAETLESSKKVMDRWGMSDIEVLQHYGILNKNTILVHGGYCALEDLKLISSIKSKIVLCPVSNQRLKTKCLDPCVLDREGIKWCLATDGLATGITANLFDHMRYAKSMFPKLENWKLWSSITYGAAQVLGIEDFYGKLDVCYHADFCVFHKETPNSVEEVLEWLIYEKDKQLSLYIEGCKKHVQNIEIPSEYKPLQPLDVNIFKQWK